MNERIQSLAEQATLLYQTMDGEWEEDFDKAKFAELIVKECAEVVYSRSGHARPQDLLKHFGVE